MGNESSVPIEPPTQTSLLDASLQVPGVLIAGVPGAGGYDAIFCVIADDGDDVYSTFHQLVTVWERWQVRVCPLLAREEGAGILFEDVEALNPCAY
jgi:phosphomevalonate kinase